MMRTQSWFGVALVSVGIVALASAWLTPGDRSIPYEYVDANSTLTEAVAASTARRPGTTGVSLALHTTPGHKVLATAQVLRDPKRGDTLMHWESLVAEPILRSDISSSEDAALVIALANHLPPQAQVYALPALSRRLAALIDGVKLPLALADDDALLQIPQPWHSKREQVQSLENRWRYAPVAQPSDHDVDRNPAGDNRVFDAFLDALLATNADGVAGLRALSGSGASYIVLHVRDAFDIGVARPDALPTGLRDFPASAQAHDAMRMVRDWITDNGYAAYAVGPRGKGTVRAWFLADSSSQSTLIAQLLPFNTAQIAQVPGTRLVYQTGGYWVYRLDSSADAATNDNLAPVVPAS